MDSKNTNFREWCFHSINVPSEWGRTVSRWFRNIGGFRKGKFYDKSTVLPLVAVALIYKAKQTEELKVNGK